MHATVLQENLKAGLAAALATASSRTPLPVLAGVLIEAGRLPTLRLASTNLEMGSSTWIGGMVLEPGAVVVPARLLYDLVQALPPGQLALTADAKTWNLTVTSGKAKSTVRGFEAVDMPAIPTAATVREAAAALPGHHCELPGATLRDLIASTAYAAATDESRPILTGVLVRFGPEGEGTLTMAAADGFRLAVTRGSGFGTGLAPNGDGKKSPDLIVPASALALVGRLIGEQDTPVEVLVPPARNQIVFHLEHTDVVSQLIDGNFPDYTQIVPKTHTTRAVVATADLQRAVRVGELFVKGESHMIRLDATGAADGTPRGTLDVRAVSAESGDNSGQVDALEFEGQRIETAFNGRYLLEALAAMKSEQIVVELSEGSRPAVLRPASSGAPDTLCVLMPMAITR